MWLACFFWSPRWGMRMSPPVSRSRACWLLASILLRIPPARASLIPALFCMSLNWLWFARSPVLRGGLKLTASRDKTVPPFPFYEFVANGLCPSRISGESALFSAADKDWVWSISSICEATRFWGDFCWSIGTFWLSLGVSVLRMVRTGYLLRRSFYPLSDDITKSALFSSIVVGRLLRVLIICSCFRLWCLYSSRVS